MKRLRPRATILVCAAVTLTAGFFLPASRAQQPATSPSKPQIRTAHKAPVHALLVSDIHFEPFWDPAKVSQLTAAPIARWKAILTSPNSADRETQFTVLQQKCHVRGEDTPYPLYASSLRAMQSAARDAKFITVSGDLISHSFSCKYDMLNPHADPGAYEAFVEKSIEFVLGQLRTTLPNARLYAALGNNDSDCGDYNLDEQGPLLSGIAGTIASGLPPAARTDAAMTFADAGYYSTPLPPPLANSRLLVLNDTFMSGRHTACSGKPDTAAAETQLTWLRDQLDVARNSHQHIWVMAHIPSGIDPYTTAARMRDVCGGSSPEMFLTSEDMPRLLAQYTDVIQLALFAHTHMDEMRLLKSDSADASTIRPGVPVKFVPSISPINGNAPAFVVAAIAPSNAVLADYRVIAAPEKNAAGYKWKEQYDYDATYHQKAFDAAALNSLFTGFAADAPGTTDASSAYLRNYYVRDRSAELRLFWPQYVCALSAYSTNDYKSCRCANPKP